MLLPFITMIALVALMIFFNALYVAGEFSSVSARKTRIEQQVAAGNRLAKMLLPVITDYHRLDSYIAASQVGITLSSIVLGIYGQQQISPLLVPIVAKLPFLSGEVAAAGLSATLVLILLTTLQVILGELVPKSLALRYPERLALLTVLPMRWSADIIFRPLIIILNGSGTVLMKLFGIKHDGGHNHVHSPEEIKFLIQQSHEGGLLDEQEHQLLDNALRFGQLRVAEIVVPRTRMIAAPVDTGVDEALILAATADHTRLPIYENDLDHIVGFIHLKELFQLSYAGEKAEIKSILREVLFVPETAYIDDVWNTLNEAECYLAIVFDEYGGTVGMVTREDLLEELFGDVEDEFDDPEIALITRLSETEFRIRGDAPILVVNDRLNIDLPIDGAHTLGGLLLNALGRLPEVGDEVELDEAQLRVQAVLERAVEEVHLTLRQRRPVIDEEDES